MRQSSTSAPEPTRERTSGFGVERIHTPYHFLVRQRADGGVLIVEHFADSGADEIRETDIPKAELSVRQWDRLADPVAQEFNTRLRIANRRAGRWLKDETAIAPN